MKTALVTGGNRGIGEGICRVLAEKGYDIFFTYEMGGLALLSQRFVDVCRENGLTNLHFRPAAKFLEKEARYFLDGIEDDEDEE